MVAGSSFPEMERQIIAAKEDLEHLKTDLQNPNNQITSDVLGKLMNQLNKMGRELDSMSFQGITATPEKQLSPSMIAAINQTLTIIKNIQQDKSLQSKVAALQVLLFSDNFSRCLDNFKSRLQQLHLFKRGERMEAVQLEKLDKLVQEKTLTTRREKEMEIHSAAFEDRKPIPKKHTCEGQDVSPPLHFDNIPTGAKTLALIMDDPDAPMGTFVHWVVWNLPPNVADLTEGATVPNQGKNHFKEAKYRGPCPPKGAPHRYYFKVYALDARIDLPNGSTKEQLEDAMEGHILAKAELVGMYQR